MTETEVWVRRSVGGFVGLIAAWFIWLGLSRGFDFGWFFIASFFVVLAYTVWPKNDETAPRH